VCFDEVRKRKDWNYNSLGNTVLFCIHTMENAISDERCSSGREISSFNVLGLFLVACTAKVLRQE
jgi:hypothetical protein